MAKTVQVLAVLVACLAFAIEARQSHHSMSTLIPEPESHPVQLHVEDGEKAVSMIQTSALSENSSSCPKNCSNNGFCLAGTCACVTGFSGADCATPECPNGCSGHGACNTSTGVCNCTLGYYGVGCETYLCPHQCHGHGYCDGKSCVCRVGYTGANCKDSIGCPGNCNGNGECIDGACYCKGSWTGKGCEQRVCPGACSGVGECNATAGVCKCPPGYKGEACEKKLCPNSCSGNGGCNYTTGICTCNPGFYGSDCNPKNCYKDCSNAGSCNYDEKAKKAYCKCDPGRSGTGCEAELCPSKCNSIKGHGRCTSEGCLCSANYTGNACETRRCPNDCTSPQNGVCDKATFTCTCLNGWTGPGCQERTCPQSCNSQGVCKNGTCACNDWWTGAACNVPTCKQDDAGRTCSGNGRCELPATSANPGSALNNVLTQSTDPVKQAKAAVNSFKANPNKARCVCNEGWTGADCSLKRCPNDCSGRGICTNAVCFCNKGFYGKDCSLVQKAKPVKTVEDQFSLRACQSRCQHGKCLLATGSVLKSAQAANAEAAVAAVKAGKTAAYECFCQEGWSGPNCAAPDVKCPTYCRDSKGLCKPGCGPPKCPVAFGKPCGGDLRGTCNPDGSCTCKDRFGGTDCSIAQCPNNCSNHGMCNTKTHKCLCLAGWSSADCSVAVR